MNEIIGNVLRLGVIVSASVIMLGIVLLVTEGRGLDLVRALVYYPNQVPHGTFDVSLSGLAHGLVAFEPFSVIELGVIVLLATPVSRVLISVFLFATAGDRTYVYITAGVLSLLLFSMLATPFIPGFNA